MNNEKKSILPIETGMQDGEVLRVPLNEVVTFSLARNEEGITPPLQMRLEGSSVLSSIVLSLQRGSRLEGSGSAGRFIDQLQVKADQSRLVRGLIVPKERKIGWLPLPERREFAGEIIDEVSRLRLHEIRSKGGRKEHELDDRSLKNGKLSFAFDLSQEDLRRKAVQVRFILAD